MNCTLATVFCTAALSLCAAISAWAHPPTPLPQSPSSAPAGVQTVEFQPPHLSGISVKFDAILPRDYAASDRRYPVLYLLHGYTGHYSDWVTRTGIVSYAGHYEEIIVMPEGENSWYVNNYADPRQQWENYIIDDLIPYVDAHFRTVATRNGRAIAGLSMGGYGALYLGLRHHDLFAAVASLSGVVASAEPKGRDKSLWNLERDQPSPIGKTLRADFGPLSNRARLGEDPFRLIRQLTPAECPQLFLAIGWGDELLDENREFVRQLSQLKLPYRYDEVPGKHEWRVWDEEVRRVLELQAPVIGALRVR